MSLYWEVRGFLEGAEGVHQFAAAGGCESGGNDGGDEGVRRVDRFDMCNRGFSVCEGGFGTFVTIKVWRHGIHAATADEGSLAVGKT